MKESVIRSCMAVAMATRTSLMMRRRVWMYAILQTLTTSANFLPTPAPAGHTTADSTLTPMKESVKISCMVVVLATRTGLIMRGSVRRPANLFLLDK